MIDCSIVALIFAAMNLIGRVSSAELPLHGKYALLSKSMSILIFFVSIAHYLRYIPFSDQILRLVEVNLLVESVKIQVTAFYLYFFHQHIIVIDVHIFLVYSKFSIKIMKYSGSFKK